MSKKTKLKRPWDNLQSAVWLVGIAILFMTGDWWPGILFVIAASILVEFVIQRLVPEAVEKEPESTATSEQFPGVPPAAPQAAPPAHPTDLLPASCPSCGARVRPNEVRWVDDRSAECGYCGSPLRHPDLKTGVQ